MNVNGAREASRRPLAAVNAFCKRLGEYKSWRDDLAAILGDYQAWVESQGLGNDEDDLRIYELMDALRSDGLTIALVAELARGKTELINAIFFSDYKQRLLPSEAGRTTMCPTELLYDAKQPPSIRLLPIETRKSAVTIAEYKRAPQHWTALALDLDDPKKLADAFLETVKTKAVHARDAEALGLYNPRSGGAGPLLTGNGEIEIPVWRHAIINYPHPLLKQGVVILDTPGLNSLGTEPELTLGMLASAQAVVFVLAADTGVTKSDLEIWNNHVRVAKGAKGEGRVVALNKIDMLWDELRAPGAVAATIARQAQETARTLGVNKNQIFPVSAQKGLLGKIKGDAALVERSGLPALELKLSGDIVAARQRIMREKIAREIGSIINATRTMIDARLDSVDAQLKELHGLNGKNQDAIQEMINRMRAEKQAYDRTLGSFQATRSVVADQTKMLLDHISAGAFDALAEKTRCTMKESWTTLGLRAAMRSLFDDALEALDKANRQAQQIKGLSQSIYNKFSEEYGLAKIKPTGFSLFIYRGQLQRLHEEAEAFRNSPFMVMIEQHFVVKKFFLTLAGRARQIFSDCHDAAGRWSKALMAPILTQVREHKMMLDQRLENLKKVHENLGSLDHRIAELEAVRQELENQLTVIRDMLRKLDQPATLDS